MIGVLALALFARQPAAAAQPASATRAQVAQTLPALLPHKALYDFRMASVTSGAGVTDIRGDMFYEQDDACDAWTTDHRFTIEYYYPERPPSVNTSHYVSWEAKDQSQFQFSSERQENGRLTEQLRGAVMRGADTTAVAEYVRPEDLFFQLPAGYVLPTFHTREIIRRAQAGEKLFHAVMFDGTDSEGPIEVNVVINRKAGTDEVLKKLNMRPLTPRTPPLKTIDHTLLSPDAWHVRMAVFPLAAGGARDDMVPTYEMDMILHDNGVVSYVLVDYKSFTVEQKLSALEKIPATTCP